METLHSDYTLTIYSSGYWFVIVPLLVVLIITIRSNRFLFDFKRAEPNRKKKWGIIIGFSIIAFFFLDEVTWLTAKAVITVNSEKMTVTKYFWGIPFAKNYDISKISNFRIEHNVSSSYYIGISHTYISHGTPLAMDPTILYFDYDGTIENIGKHLNNFQADNIINAIEKGAKISRFSA